nr:NAD(P)/FAD-dependent oxidoreductase [Bacilli bacterium]
MQDYDVVIIGAGAGGLQAAIHLGRYRWKTLVIDKGKGRTFYTPTYHNLLGYPEGVSGAALLHQGRQQAKQFGVDFMNKIVLSMEKQGDHFLITAQRRKEVIEGSAEQIDHIRARRVVLATGIMDEHPDVPNIYHYAGFSVLYCPDCDGYELIDKKVVIVGRGNGGPSLAKTLLAWTSDLTVVNIDKEKPIREDWLAFMESYGIPNYTGELDHFVGEQRETIEQVVLKDGTTIACEKVFSALGMHSKHTKLATDLGAQVNDSGYLIVDPRTKETNVAGLWAVGDVVAHSQQVMIAMGEGAQAAIWVNKSLRKDGLPEASPAYSKTP